MDTIMLCIQHCPMWLVSKMVMVLSVVLMLKVTVLDLTMPTSLPTMPPHEVMMIAGDIPPGLHRGLLYDTPYREGGSEVIPPCPSRCP